MSNVPEAPVPPHLHELLAAIAAALDVPLADRPEDDEAAARILRERASNARIIASNALTSPSADDIQRAANQLRTWTAEAPVTYRSWQERAADPAETPVTAEPADGTRRCGHDDYHDGHPWHERPDVWCPGISSENAGGGEQS